MQRIIKVKVERFGVTEDSQFPLWDFFECNIDKAQAPVEKVEKSSQFPLWDFFECNGILVEVEE